MTPEETRLTFFDVVQKDDFRESVIKRLQSNSQGKVGTLSCDSQNQRIPVDVSIQPTAIYLGYHFLKPFFYYDTDDRKAYERARENLLTFNELMEFIIGNRIPLYLMRPTIGRYHLNSVPLDANQLMALIAEHVDAPQEMRYYHTVQDMLIRSLPV